MGLVVFLGLADFLTELFTRRAVARVIESCCNNLNSRRVKNLTTMTEKYILVTKVNQTYM